MKCPWCHIWEGPAGEFPKHLETCPEYQKPSERPGEYRLKDVSEDINGILNKINLRFVPTTKDEEFTIKALKIRLMEASSLLMPKFHD